MTNYECGRTPSVLLLGFLVVFGTTAAIAQDVQVAVQDPPYYVGEPALVRLAVRGFEERPEPTCDVPTSSPDLRARIASIQPNVSRSMKIATDPATGRQNVEESVSVVYVIDFHVSADTPGEYVLGPFEITQGSKKLQAKSVTLKFQDVPLDPDMRVRLLLPEKPIYPDQRVPVTVEWWYAGDFEAIHKLQIHSPLFDLFTFAPDPEPDRRTNTLPIDTEEGKLNLPAQVRRETADGRTFTVLSAKRTLIPSRAGSVELKPITATLRKVTQWARSRSAFDGFGGSLFDDLMGERRRPAKTELIKAVGAAKTLVVKPFPVEGRPESFAGAVGSGFSLDVAADRTVVRVGDPITLTVALRGAGNIENASLPSLAADGGMNPELFRLPEGDSSGTTEDGTKTFQVSVRVKDESVSEIPALAYSWFDPEEEKYHTTHSKPIALRVMPATIVSADDVVSAPTKKTDQAGGGQTHGASPSNNQSPSSSSSRRPFSLAGADLSAERDVAKLLRDAGGPFSGVTVQASLYLIGLLLIVAAVIDRKRSDVPRDVVVRRKQIRELSGRIGRARQMPPRQAAEEVSNSLRGMVAILPDVARDEAQRIIAQCESIVYAPSDTDAASLESPLLDDAVAVAEKFVKEKTE